MSSLFIVATPIGNLEDITIRAKKVLENSPVIACEDTRHTGQLLLALGIFGKRLIACHAHNEEQSAAGIIKLLSEGSDVAYCSDAGTPGVSDPGSRLVTAVRQAGFKVIPLPGASACTTLISAAGMIGKSWTFEGFLSPKSGKRNQRLKELLERNEAFVIYESPFRIVKTLEELKNLAPERNIVLGRELTKNFEEIICSNAENVLKQLKTVKGEFALCILPEGKTKDDNEK